MVVGDIMEDKINHLFEEVGTGWEDFYDVHTLSVYGVDVECIHLTPKAKQRVKSLIRDELFAIDRFFRMGHPGEAEEYIDNKLSELKD
jgi:hypothetical protein